MPLILVHGTNRGRRNHGRSRSPSRDNRTRGRTGPSRFTSSTTPSWLLAATRGIARRPAWDRLTVYPAVAPVRFDLMPGPPVPIHELWPTRRTGGGSPGSCACRLAGTRRGWLSPPASWSAWVGSSPFTPYAGGRRAPRPRVPRQRSGSCPAPPGRGRSARPATDAAPRRLTTACVPCSWWLSSSRWSSGLWSSDPPPTRSNRRRRTRLRFPTAQPQVLPAVKMPDWPRATPTGTPPASPSPASRHRTRTSTSGSSVARSPTAPATSTHRTPGLTDAVNTGPEPAPLAPNWLAVGLVVFEVKESTRITSFRFGPWPTVSEQTQEWSLADG